METLTKEQIAAAVAEALKQHFWKDMASLDMGAPCSVHGLDSLDMLELLFKVEEILGVCFKENRSNGPYIDLSLENFIEQLFVAGIDFRTP